MKVRLWLVEHRLTAAEEQRVREYRRARTDHEGQVKITYRKKRFVVTNADGWDSVEEAVNYALTDREEIEDIPGVFRHFTTVFAAAPAEDGEKCLQIENAWTAEEVELPFQE